jgi:diguanylate cyclase (GGDEF)-like protein
MFFCRWGGDEFLLILAQGQTIQTLEAATEGIDERFKELQEKVYHVGEQQLSLTFSFGLAFFLEKSKNLEQLISIADIKMYSEKKLQKISYL